MLPKPGLGCLLALLKTPGMGIAGFLLRNGPMEHPRTRVLISLTPECTILENIYNSKQNKSNTKIQR